MKNGRYSQCQLVVPDFFSINHVSNKTCNITNKNVQTQRVHRFPHGPIAEIFCRQVETMMTTSEESPLMKAQLFRDHLFPQKQTCLAGKSSLLIGDTLPKTTMEPEHHVFEKEHHLNQTSIFRVQNVFLFFGGSYIHPTIHAWKNFRRLSFVRYSSRPTSTVWDTFFAPTDVVQFGKPGNPIPKIAANKFSVLGKNRDNLPIDVKWGFINLGA